LKSDYRQHTLAPFHARNTAARRQSPDALLTDRAMEQRRQVRRLLTLVRAVVRGTSVALAAEDYVAQLSGRLDAIARVQELLMRRPGADVDLMEILEDEFLTQRVSSPHVALPVCPLMVERRVALLFALALHELTTNAIQYGALRTPQGVLAVQWGLGPTAGWMSFEWHEEFSALPAEEMHRDSGFGFKFIRDILPGEIAANTSISLQRRSLTCQIAFRASGPGH